MGFEFQILDGLQTIHTPSARYIYDIRDETWGCRNCMDHFNDHFIIDTKNKKSRSLYGGGINC